MATDFYGFEDDEPRAQGRDHLFLWTVFILLLIGIAFACWLGSFYVFGHPEQPRSYAILKRLHKIEPLKRFEVTAAPTGEFLTPQKLFERYSKFERLQLDAVNAELMRNYIKNYKETKGLVPYVTGRFEIVDTYELKPTDLFPSGVVAVGTANEYSQVVIEHVFTTPPDSVAALKASLPVGLDMRLERTRDPVAIIHVEWTDDGTRLVFTAMPLLYGTWGVKGGINSFSLEPPESLNLKAHAPIVKGPAFADMMARFAAAGHLHVAANDDSGAPSPAEPELVRVETVKPGQTVPETGAMPQVVIATPIPVVPATPKGLAAAATPKGRGTPARATPTMLAMRGTPAPATPPRLASNPPPPSATPFPASIPGLPPVENLVTPKTTVPPGVYKPFVGSAPVAMGNGNWRTYQRGQQPPGRSITPSEAGKMADRGGEIAERLYLRGDFVVTASGDNRAVLRAPASLGEASRDGVSSTRILVEFPPSAELPSVGSTLSRGEAEGFEVREVRRGQDGQINIFVREITRGG
ncbi:MAG TPA: hypothetical protein VGO11_23740 [Chthoniobacteraceae bacterium]|jgi:hypothetical protein|nr:hypothetical protein [Chthoniobacteraceae bacterium]